MSRARELAKLGGAGQQVIAGVSSFVGISTFASDVFMYDDLSVLGNLNVTGDLSYDETTATNSKILGVSTTKDLVVTQNAVVTGIITAANDKVVIGAGVTDLLVRGNARVTGILTIGNSSATLSDTGMIVGSSNLHSTGVETIQVNASGLNATGIVTAARFDGRLTGNINATGISTATTLSGTTATYTRITANGGFTGNINAAGVSTVTFLQASTVNVSGAATVGGNFTVTGDLTVNGTTTTINSATLTVDDKNIELASTASPSDALADGAGITVKGTSDKTFNWVDATDAWTSSEHMNLLTGKEYKINNALVLSSTALGTGITTSKLTHFASNITIDGATVTANVAPNANNTIDLGSSANRWANVYSNDLDLSNEGSANSIDGTWGSYLVQEGEEHLYIINRRSGKKFRFVLEEV